MIVAGAGGHAKDLLEVFTQLNQLEELYFFDDTGSGANKLFDRFIILNNLDAVRDVFNRSGDFRFALGTGSPQLRFKLTQKMESAGGKLTTIQSPFAKVGSFGTTIGAGANVMTGAIITNQVIMGVGCLVHHNVSVAHDNIIGDFVELLPGANISGNCAIGNFSVIGSNATILKGIRIGSYATIGAGAVVIQDVPDGATVAGVPAVIKKQLPPESFLA